MTSLKASNIIFLLPKIKLNAVFSTFQLSAKLNFFLVGRIKQTCYF